MIWPKVIATLISAGICSYLMYWTKGQHEILIDIAFLFSLLVIWN